MNTNELTNHPNENTYHQCMLHAHCTSWYSGAGGLSSANAGALATQNSRKSVPVYADENAMPSLLPDQNEEYASVPLPEVIDRENQLQPGRWNDARVSIV